MAFKNILPLNLAGLALLLSACASSISGDTNPGPSPDPVPPPQRSSQVANTFPQELYLCPMTSVSNAPPSDQLKVRNYAPQVIAEGRVILALAPVEKGCVSSGFGPRSGRTHKGVDYHTRDAVDVYAAAAGTVREKLYRNDYGNMLVIDHGDGVFTRYAHLETFGSGLSVGAQVRAGQTIGLMGNTASYRIPRHLHYEVLTGTWGAQAGSFALAPIDPFSLPAVR